MYSNFKTIEYSIDIKYAKQTACDNISAILHEAYTA